VAKESDTPRYAKQVCPECGALWFMKGDLDPGTGTWGVIPESGPVDGTQQEIECPECEHTFVPGPATPTKKGIPRSRWVLKD
jgi:hypothetical protein